MSNLQLVNALLYITEHDCKWRALPATYGNWHTVYVRMNRWSKSGVLQRLFEALQKENIIRIKIESVCLESTTVKDHPDDTEALEKNGSKATEDPQESSPPKFLWLPHLTVRL